jgi:hypothetical protein
MVDGYTSSRDQSIITHYPPDAASSADAFSSLSLIFASSQHFVQAATAMGKHSGVSADDDDDSLLLLSPPLLSLPAAVRAARMESTHDTRAFCCDVHCFSHAVGSTSVATGMLLLAEALGLMGKDHMDF